MSSRSDHRPDTRTHITQLHFEEVGKFFATAWIGQESREAKAEVEGSLSWEDALSTVTARAAKVFEVENSWVTIFHNTTGAIQRILTRLASFSPGRAGTLLTTNVEYPGIMALLRDSWPGKIGVVDCGQSIAQGETAQTLERLRSAVLVTQPSIVFLSHVVRSSGFVVPEAFFRFVRETRPQCVVVVDGAQAVGNVAIEPTLVQEGIIDFYVTSGQKWLCGRPTLALVWCDPSWKVQDPSQSYSRRVGSGGTGDLRSLRSLGASLRDFVEHKQAGAGRSRLSEIARHNAALAQYFCERVESVGLREQLDPLPLRHGGGWEWSGIVALWRVGSRFCEHLLGRRFVTTSILQETSGELAKDGFMIKQSSAISGEGLVIRAGLEYYDQNGVPQEGCCRVCFHYYHSRTDVDALVKAVTAAAAEMRAK